MEERKHQVRRYYGPQIVCFAKVRTMTFGFHVSSTVKNVFLEPCRYMHAKQGNNQRDTNFLLKVLKRF